LPSATIRVKRLWIESSFRLKIILLHSFQITQTQENQITYIRDRRILEQPDTKPNYIKWLETLDTSTEEKPIHYRTCFQTLSKNLQLKNKWLADFVTPHPLTQSLESWLKMSRLNKLSMVESWFLKRRQANKDISKEWPYMKEDLKRVNENREPKWVATNKYHLQNSQQPDLDSIVNDHHY